MSVCTALDEQLELAGDRAPARALAGGHGGVFRELEFRRGEPELELRGSVRRAQ